MARVPSPARRLRDALEPVAALSFHSEPATEAYAGLGLDEFFHAYFWLRSSVLGEVAPAVVVAAFGVWPAEDVVANLAVGRRAASLEQIRSATDHGAASAARLALCGVEEGVVRKVVEALRRGIDAADPAARPLFAGNRALSVVEDPYGALWRAATAWRELRGDTHLAACMLHGVTGLEANVLNELDNGYELGEYTATRNWSDADIRRAADGLHERGLLDGEALSEDGRALRDRLEEETDRGVATAIDAVGDDLEEVVATADDWSRRIIDRGWFPDENRKRRAG